MKRVNKTMLFILVTLYAMSPGLTAYAEPDTQGENKGRMSLLGWTHLKAEKGFHLAFDASGSYGPIHGYAQVPLGGGPSSTSDKRPKFDELGIDKMTMVNLCLLAGMDSHHLYGSAHLVDLSGKDTLHEELIFRNRRYPAGTRVKSDISLNWYEIGYQYNIHFSKERMNLHIAPTVAYALWDSSVELESNNEKTRRSYISGTPRLGLDFEWFPAKRFSISGKAIGSIPFKYTPHIYTVVLAGKYNLMEINRLKISLFVGVEYNLIDFKDNQSTPNHVKASMGPLGLIGAEIKF